MTLVDEDEDVALRLEAGRQVPPDLVDVGVHVAGRGLVRGAELVDERRHQPLGALVEHAYQVAAAPGAMDLLAHAPEDLLYLLVQLGAVGDDEHPAVRHVLADPLRQPDHGQALPAALGVPDDAAFPAPHVRLRRPHPEVLVVPARLLHAGVEHDEVVDDLEQPLLAADLAEIPQQRVVAGGGERIGLLPPEPLLLGRLDHAVAQPLGLVAGHQKLHGGVERADELGLLAVEVLADPFRHRHRRALQLKHAEGEAVDVEHEVGPPGVRPRDRHGDRLLAGLRPHLHAVAQQVVDRAVGVVERPVAPDRRRLAERVQDLGDDAVVVAPPPEPAGERRLLDVGVPGTVAPVAQMGVAEGGAEERGDAPLRADLPLADRAHDPPPSMAVGTG